MACVNWNLLLPDENREFSWPPYLLRGDFTICWALWVVKVDYYYSTNLFTGGRNLVVAFKSSALFVFFVRMFSNFNSFWLGTTLSLTSGDLYLKVNFYFDNSLGDPLKEEVSSSIFMVGCKSLFILFINNSYCYWSNCPSVLISSWLCSVRKPCFLLCWCIETPLFTILVCWMVFMWLIRALLLSLDIVCWPDMCDLLFVKLNDILIWL